MSFSGEPKATTLDVAVFASYGWPADLSQDTLLAALPELSLQRASAVAGCSVLPPRNTDPRFHQPVAAW